MGKASLIIGITLVLALAQYRGIMEVLFDAMIHMMQEGATRVMSRCGHGSS
jgi:hypothetical protein